MDAACKTHDIAYSQNQSLEERHKADKVLEDFAWKRVKAKDAKLGERANALLVTGAMKVKRKLGMGVGRGRRRRQPQVSFRRNVIQKVAKSLQPASTLKQTALNALKTARMAVKQAGGKKRIRVPRIIPFEQPKTGGMLPLIPLFAALSALGALSGGAAGIAKTVIDAKNARQKLEEDHRHNKAMESLGKGLYLRKNAKGGYGLYLQKNSL